MNSLSILTWIVLCGLAGAMCYIILSNIQRQLRERSEKERDAAIREKIETMNRQSVLAIEARRLCGYHAVQYPEVTVKTGLMRGSTFSVN